jgi:hypothetical protein
MIIPSTLPSGTWMSAVSVHDLGGLAGKRDLSRIVGEGLAISSEAGAARELGVEALGDTPVHRQDVVFSGLRPPQVLQLAKLLRILGRKIIGLREVLPDVVELPLLLVGIETGAHRLPRHERKGRGHPAVVIEAAIGPHFEVLRRVVPSSPSTWFPASCVCRRSGPARCHRNALAGTCH